MERKVLPFWVFEDFTKCYRRATDFFRWLWLYPKDELLLRDLQEPKAWIKYKNIIKMLHLLQFLTEIPDILTPDKCPIDRISELKGQISNLAKQLGMNYQSARKFCDIARFLNSPLGSPLDDFLLSPMKKSEKIKIIVDKLEFLR